MRTDVTPKKTRTSRQLSECEYFGHTRCKINRNNNLEEKTARVLSAVLVGNSKEIYKRATAGVSLKKIYI